MAHPYGDGFARQISKTRAANLCGEILAPIPRIGYGTCIRETSDGFGGFFRLNVENVSGAFFLASHNV